MTLAAGSHIGPYEVVSSLGAGGMGEVYRARDTRLKREVALKILPASFAGDPDRLARFQREAEVLAALNHPLIAAIYGLEDAPGGDGSPVRALVLELVEGETLADRIARGPLPIGEALPIARQIAEALEAAHELGIIHRDLKPANIKITPDGIVKVLDFGLAKLHHPNANVPNGPNDPNVMSMSPTLTSPVMATGIGVILGTAAYMAPEQAKGRAADKRTDVWAFGCVLYEMLTGRRPFDGEDIADMMAAVLRGEPDWSALPPALPAPLRTLLQRALAKDRRQRFGDLAAALMLLDQASTAAPVSEPLTRTTVAVPRWRRPLVAAMSMMAGAAVAGGVVWYVLYPTPPRVTRLTLTLPREAALILNGVTRDLSISADGSTIAYAGGTPAAVFVRPLDRLAASPLAGVGQARHPVLSADGSSVAYFDGSNALRTSTTSGSGTTIALGRQGARGATWVEGGALVFATFDPSLGLQRVGANRGEPETLTLPDRGAGELDHLWPEALPGGKAVLFTIQIAGSPPDQWQIAALDLATKTKKLLLRGGSHAQYVPPGYLVFGVAGALRAVRFDLRRVEVIGTPVPVVDTVNMTTQGAVNASISADGTLVYVTGGAGSAQRVAVWVDRRGQETPVGAPARAYVTPRLAPDGRRIALYASDQDDDIWVWDGTLTRLTFDKTRDYLPVWTPDGQRLIWTSLRDGALNLYMQAADGTGPVTRLTDSVNAQQPTTITPDGGRVVLYETRNLTGQDVMVVALDGSKTTTPLLATPATERNGEVSPDGRWLAYESDESGQLEIYVRPFPNVDSGKWQVSTAGGTRPAWRRQGTGELYYWATDGALMAVPVTADGTRFRAGTPAQVVRPGYSSVPGFTARQYDVSPDGQRFLMLKDSDPAAGASAPTIVVVQHWVEELKRLVKD